MREIAQAQREEAREELYALLDEMTELERAISEGETEKIFNLAEALAETGITHLRKIVELEKLAKLLEDC